jgi:AcrR family transcriptional regulator
MRSRPRRSEQDRRVYRSTLLANPLHVADTVAVRNLSSIPPGLTLTKAPESRSLKPNRATADCSAPATGEHARSQKLKIYGCIEGTQRLWWGPMWDQANIKLTGGPHGIPRTVVTKIQRDRLLRAMAKTVAEYGYQETTVRRLLGRAGLSRRTYYELFEDKEACFLAAYDEAVDHMLDLAVEAYAEGESPEERIERALRALLQFCADEPDIARMCIVEVLAAGPIARARRAETMERLSNLMEGALNELRGDERLSKLAARGLIGGVHELIYTPIDRGETESLPDLAEQIVSSQVAPLVLLKT